MELLLAGLTVSNLSYNKFNNIHFSMFSPIFGKFSFKWKWKWETVDEIALVRPLTMKCDISCINHS